jgi:glutathione S-transferase
MGETRMKLTLYTNPMSRGRMVRWMLEEIGQPYDTEIVAYGAGMKSPEYCAINPMGKVPALRHGDMVVTETSAIIAYLADAFPEARLAPPPASPLRGPYYRWLFYAAGCLEAAITNKALGVVVPAERERMVGYGSFEAVMDVLEAAVSKPAYLLGDEFSAADVYLGSQLGFGMRFGMIDKRPAFEAYYARMQARPALQRATQIDDQLMAAASVA